MLMKPAVATAAPARRLGALAATTLALGLSGQIPDAAMADNGAGPAHDLRVGHRVERVIVPGTLQGEPRQVDVHLWYPARQRGLSAAPRTVYTSRLYNRPLVPGR